MDSFNDVFQEVLKYCRNCKSISEPGYNKWIKILEPMKLENNVAYLLTDSDFSRDITMNAYENLLKEAFLNTLGGRLCIITFHSLEDRLVKQRFQSFCKGCICPPDFPQCICGRTPRGKLVNRKPIEADEKELAENNRSRSAKLRVIEKIKD